MINGTFVEDPDDEIEDFDFAFDDETREGHIRLRLPGGEMFLDRDDVAIVVDSLLHWLVTGKLVAEELKQGRNNS